VKIALGRYRTLLFLLAFMAVWMLRNDIRDLADGFFEGYGENQAMHAGDG